VQTGAVPISVHGRGYLLTMATAAAANADAIAESSSAERPRVALRA
jgi:hypothetical protein